MTTEIIIPNEVAKKNKLEGRLLTNQLPFMTGIATAMTIPFVPTVATIGLVLVGMLPIVISAARSNHNQDKKEQQFNAIRTIIINKTNLVIPDKALEELSMESSTHWKINDSQSIIAAYEKYGKFKKLKLTELTIDPTTGVETIKYLS
jgi:hypothetical protein